MGEFGEELARRMATRGVGVRELARRVHYNAGHISNLRTGRARPSPELAADLDTALDAGGALAELAPRPGRAGHPHVIEDQAAGDEIAAFELGRRAKASDVGNETADRLARAVDDLAIAYPGAPPGELLGRVRAHLGYVGQLLGVRSTLGQHRALLVT
ncbi:MAG TPA: helix-turn-helix transcriptional regulator, partial [Streptosporangiaceae bacterium]|nr:helix-turn-helix transcriptional regulator [Streptosporangiaceae bacterium]